MLQDPGRTQPDPNSSTSLLDRFFLYLEKFAWDHPISVITVSLLVAGVSIVFTVERLTFKTSRSDLVNAELPYVKTYEKYREDFEDFEGMIVVVEGKNPSDMKGFSESFVKKLGKESLVISKVLYKMDTDYFRDKGFLFMNFDELRDLGDKLRDHQKFMDQVNPAPGLNQLLTSINAEISSGMVDSLLTRFLGSDEDRNDDTSDLSLLVALLKEMASHVGGDSTYRSPWKSFLRSGKNSLREDGYIVSEDEKLLLIFIVPNKGETGFAGPRDTIDFVRKMIAETALQFPALEIGLTGEDVIASDEMVTTRLDVKKASIIALIGVALLFILAYGGVVKPMLAMFCLVVALCWSMGYTTLAVGHLNILSVVFTTILIGLGIDFGIHILERYKEERLGGNDPMIALQNTVQGTGRGNFAGAITTAMAFGGMSLTDFVGIVELGIIAAGGILLCFLSMVLLLPATVTVEEKWFRPDYRKSHWIGTINGNIEKIFDHYFLIIFVSGGLFVLSLIPLWNLSFDYNLLNLQAKEVEAVKYEMKIIESAKRSVWSMAMVADSFEDAAQKHKSVQQMSEVANVESIVSLLPERQSEKIEYIKTLTPVLEGLEVDLEDEEFSLDRLKKMLKKIRFKLQGREEKKGQPDEVGEAGLLAQRVLEEVERVGPGTAEERLAVFSKTLFQDYREKMEDLKKKAYPSPVKIEELPPIIKSRFVSENGGYLVTIYPSIDIWDVDAREALMTKLQAIDPDVTGNAVHMFESSKLMKNGYIQGGIYAMIAIIIYVFTAVKNLRTTLFVLLPVAVGSVWTVGIMRLLDIHFNLANLVILPLIIGIGVVNGVHIVHRYREEPDQGTTVLSKSTGQAVILSSLTTMIGFGSMMVAEHQGVYSLGQVLTIGVGSCLLASITVLPAILKLSAARDWKI